MQLIGAHQRREVGVGRRGVGDPHVVDVEVCIRIGFHEPEANPRLIRQIRRQIDLHAAVGDATGRAQG